MDETKAQALTKWCFMLAAYPDFDDMRGFFSIECAYCTKTLWGCTGCPLEGKNICVGLHSSIAYKIRKKDRCGLKTLIKSMINAIWEA